MRFLANENFPGTAVAALIASGHDVVWVRNVAPGVSDKDVLAWAIRDERILRTPSAGTSNFWLVFFRVTSEVPN
jgi:predicted nuclease of predicted toxin-antitoxin system